MTTGRLFVTSYVFLKYVPLVQSVHNTDCSWQIYKDATLFFSQDNVSTIANVIPTMDRIDSLLNNAATEPLSPAVKQALSFARKSINKYYSKTDLSNIYRIAMGMLRFIHLCSL